MTGLGYGEPTHVAKPSKPPISRGTTKSRMPFRSARCMRSTTGTCGAIPSAVRVICAALSGDSFSFGRLTGICFSFCPRDTANSKATDVRPWACCRSALVTAVFARYSSAPEGNSSIWEGSKKGKPNPVSFARVLRYSGEGRYRLASIEAIPDCVVPIRSASSVCVNPAISRANFIRLPIICPYFRFCCRSCECVYLWRCLLWQRTCLLTE